MFLRVKNLKYKKKPKKRHNCSVLNFWYSNFRCNFDLSSISQLIQLKHVWSRRRQEETFEGTKEVLKGAR
uniref:Histone H3.3B n=1 Tax=Pararge aegeria TaxID=116150 RepID=S4P2K3_9NEOP